MAFHSIHHGAYSSFWTNIPFYSALKRHSFVFKFLDQQKRLYSPIHHGLYSSFLTNITIYTILDRKSFLFISNYRRALQPPPVYSPPHQSLPIKSPYCYSLSITLQELTRR